MDGRRIALFCRMKYFPGVQVGFQCGCATDGDGLCAPFEVECIAVDIGIDGNRRDSHLFCGPGHAAGDFPPVGDEQFFKHPYILKTPNRVSPIAALREADKPRASTLRVSAGSMMPSSHNRALA